ncbi:MAG: CDP-diacylglycerol--glycerol-3-phosphate 3-phosphatidyltransferase [Pseudomonadota bacterium]
MPHGLWNLPNILTTGRILAVPLLVLVFVLLDRPLADRLALMLFAVAAATDFLDGWLARRYGQESAFGRMLDPIADKAMVIVGLMLVLALAGPGPIPLALLLPAAIIGLREVVIAGVREFLGDVKLAVTPLAKWKTTAQLIAVGFLLAEGAFGGLAPVLGQLGLGLLWLAALLTAVTGWDYFQKAMTHIRDQEG